MGTVLIAGLLTIAGVVVGTLLEPVKLLIAARGRTRTIRGEQCARFIQATEAAKHGLIQMNAVERAKRARVSTPATEQVFGWIAEINQAKGDMRLSAALLRLYGPDELADQAAHVLKLDDELLKLGKEPDEGQHQLDEPPPRLRAAADRVDSAVQDFARLARRSTR